MANQVWDAYGVWIGYGFGYGFNHSQFRTKSRPKYSAARHYWHNEWTDLQKKKIKLLTGYGLCMDLGMDLAHTKSEPKFGLDIQRERSSSLAGIHGSHGICGTHGINGIHGHLGIHGSNDNHGIHGFHRMSIEAMGSWIPWMKAWNPRIP